MRGVLANLCGGKAFGRLLEVAGQIMEGAQVRARGTFGVVTARDFLARYLFRNDSQGPPCDRNLPLLHPECSPNGPREASADRLSSSSATGNLQARPGKGLTLGEAAS